MIIKIAWYYFMNRQSNKQIITSLKRTIYVNVQCKIKSIFKLLEKIFFI